MKRLLLLATCFIIASRGSAQIVGTDCFLQGQFLEVGVNAMAGFGTCSSPASYHSHGPTYSPTPSLTALAGMDCSYDWGHDGWLTGTPSCMGSYTQPGYPQEGWSVQVGATEYRNGGWGGICTGSFDIPGTHIGYINSGGDKIDEWNGNIVGLNITQETRVDTLASWVTVTTTLRNTTSSPIANVWYERTCDPDNTSYWGGGSTTRNRIVHQNEDARHMVMVSSNSEATPYNAANSYYAYATKDCRARCGIINSLSPSNIPSQLWTNTPTVAAPVVLGLLGTNNSADQGMYLVYNIGTIPANDSAVVSYAVVFDDSDGINSAFPDPQIVINGTPRPVVPPPYDNYDSFNVCLYPGLLSFPVAIAHGDDKDWSFSHWTWSPALGLSASTGTSVTIDPTVLPAVITYTIVGTDSASGMYSCNHKVFYMTIFTCNGATSNAPCVGDTLWFNAPGDSTMATYVWFGPAPSTSVFSTTQRNYRFPAAMTDTGTYTVIKSVGGVPVDTATTTVTIHALPVVSPTSDQVACQPVVGTLHLFAGDDAGVSWAWTGPLGYTSTDHTPVIYGFDSTMQGTYVVTATTLFGCKTTNAVNVWPGVIPEFDTTKFPGCPYDSVIFANLTTNANIYEWDFGDGTTHDFNRNPPEHIYTAGHHSYNVTLKATNAHCTSTITHSIDLSHDITADFSATDTVCNGTPVVFTDLSTAHLYGASVSPLAAHSLELRRWCYRCDQWCRSRSHLRV